MATAHNPQEIDTSGVGPHTISLAGAATNGRDIIAVMMVDGAGTYNADFTFNGSAMTSVVTTNFNTWRIARFRVTAGGTDCVVSVDGSVNIRGVIFEVSGLDAADAEDFDTKVDSPDNPGTAHGIDYDAGSANRWGVGGMSVSTAKTFAGASGATAENVGSQYGFAYKDALGSAAGEINYTVSSSDSCAHMWATFLTTSTQSQPSRSMQQHRLRRQ